MTPSVNCQWAARLCPRSEEHTSELQSQSNLVCRLLLEKKKIEVSLSCSCFVTRTNPGQHLDRVDLVPPFQARTLRTLFSHSVNLTPRVLAPILIGMHAV